MPRRRDWNFSEEKKLKENYTNKTIFELMEMFPGRSQESINNKIKRLKRAGKLTEGKKDEVIQRSYEQRGKDND